MPLTRRQLHRQLLEYFLLGDHRGAIQARAPRHLILFLASALHRPPTEPSPAPPRRPRLTNRSYNTIEPYRVPVRTGGPERSHRAIASASTARLRIAQPQCRPMTVQYRAWVVAGDRPAAAQVPQLRTESAVGTRTATATLKDAERTQGSSTARAQARITACGRPVSSEPRM